MNEELNFDTTKLNDKSSLDLETVSDRVLVLEDDFTFKPFWMNVLRQCCPDAKIDWVQTEEAAERRIKQLQKQGFRYSLIVADIFLSGKRTGIDLWSQYSQVIDNFVFVSSLPREKFDMLVEAEGFSYPVYLQKPLKASVCVDVIKQVIGTK